MGMACKHPDLGTLRLHFGMDEEGTPSFLTQGGLAPHCILVARRCPDLGTLWLHFGMDDGRFAGGGAHIGLWLQRSASFAASLSRECVNCFVLE